MAEPYNIYDAVERGSVSRSSFAGYTSSEFPSVSSDFIQKDINQSRPGSYGLDGYSRVGVPPESVNGGIVPGGGNGYRLPPEDPCLLSRRRDGSVPVIGGAMPGSCERGYPSPLEDPNLLSQRGDASVHAPPAIPDVINDRPVSWSNANCPPAPVKESNILFVNGLPTDCTRREVGHLFRPFIGYKDIKVVHKEARNIGDKASVLCFVEFNDAKCAATAMEALQGYKIDDKKPDSPTLKIQFAHFPFCPRSSHDGQRSGIQR